MLSIEEYKAVFDAAPDGFLVVGRDGTIRAANPKVEQLFGWPLAELVGQPVEVLLPDELREAHVELRKAFVRRPQDRPMGAGYDLKARRRDGTIFPVEVSLSPWRTESGEELSVVCSIRDVSSVRRLRNFSEGALHASEEERQRIARELHDDTAQRLATLILRVRSLAHQPSATGRQKLFEQVRAEIVDAAEGVKRMARGLRPPELEELGLELALRAHARNLMETGTFRVQMEFGSIDPYLDTTAKLAVYRIVQEAISNARRHSGAEAAAVRMRREGGFVFVEIEDDGDGFVPSLEIDGSRGLGLVGMQERATMLGGRLAIDSEPGQGTRVRVTVPVNSQADLG